MMSSIAEGTPFPRYLGANNDDVNISNSGRNPVPFSPLSRFSANGVGFGERLLRNRERNLPGIDHSQSQGSKSSSFSLSSTLFSSLVYGINWGNIMMENQHKYDEISADRGIDHSLTRIKIIIIFFVIFDFPINIPANPEALHIITYRSV